MPLGRKESLKIDRVTRNANPVPLDRYFLDGQWVMDNISQRKGGLIRFFPFYLDQSFTILFMIGPKYN